MIDFIRQSVLPYFGIGSSDAKVSSLGNGHINDTFLVRWSDGEFVLQGLNTQVFKTPNALVENAHKISEHLARKRKTNDYSLKVVKPVRTDKGLLAVDLASLPEPTALCVHL